MDEENARAKFLAAWEVFARTCWNSRGPEATFQAWLAHYLISQFGIDRVAREISFNPTRIESSWQHKFPGHAVRLDNVVTNTHGIDFATLAFSDDRSGVRQLGRLRVISELKVASTQGEGLEHTGICLDVWKLSMVLDAADRAGLAAPLAFACILDNPWQSTRHYNASHLVNRLAEDPPHSHVTVLLHDGHNSQYWRTGMTEFNDATDI